MGMDSIGTGIMPVYDTNSRNDDGYGNGAWMWVMMLFFLLAWGNGGFFGNRENSAAEGALTRSDMCQEFNFNGIENGIRGIQNGLCDGFYAQNTTMLQGFNGLENTLCQQFAGVSRDLCSGFNGINQNINQARFEAQNCCCETNRNIDSVRFQSERNTCDITNAIHAEGEATRALITQNEVQSLRDQLQAAQLQLGNVAQTQTLIDQIRPCARPAYITCSPYQANNCGCGCC